MSLSFLPRLFGARDRRRDLDTLYRSIVALGRDPDWYRIGQIPDTIDGRFDLIAAITALVLLRLEAEGDDGRQPSVLLAELFIDDMDASLRQIGVGEYVVGKHVKRMMGALGGRLGTLRDTKRDAEGLRSFALRNLFHDQSPSEATLDWVAARLASVAATIDGQSLDSLIDQGVPA